MTGDLTAAQPAEVIGSRIKTARLALLGPAANEFPHLARITNLTPEEKAQRRAQKARKRLEMLRAEMRKDLARLHEMLKPPAR